MHAHVKYIQQTYIQPLKTIKIKINKHSDMRDFTLSITVAAPALSRTLATGTFKHMMALTIGPKFAFTHR
jgi:hypothetical protein